jgi:hypothetical protein
MCEGKIGGGNRDRTCDIQLAKLALSQLSYAPTRVAKSKVSISGRNENLSSRKKGQMANRFVALAIPSYDRNITRGLREKERHT